MWVTTAVNLTLTARILLRGEGWRTIPKVRRPSVLDLLTRLCRLYLLKGVQPAIFAVFLMVRDRRIAMPIMIRAVRPITKSLAFIDGGTCEARIFFAIARG